MNCPALSLRTEHFFCSSYIICKYFMEKKRQEERMKFNHSLLLSESSVIFPLACAATYFGRFGGPGQRTPLQLVIGCCRDNILQVCTSLCVCEEIELWPRSCWCCELQVAQPVQGKKHLCWILQFLTVQGDVGPREVTLPDPTDPIQTLHIHLSWQPSPKEFSGEAGGLRGLVFNG